MNLKSCKQCGQVKPLEQFRKYYGGRQGTYTMCKDCERINSREKYLKNKTDPTDIEAKELEGIYQLWSTQKALGFQPPRVTTKQTKSVADIVSGQSELYATLQPAEGISDAATPELLQWLECALTKEPEYYQDEVYEALREKYRPVLRIDNNSMTPVYDDTYKAILDKILERFDNYEDNYYD